MAVPTTNNCSVRVKGVHPIADSHQLLHSDHQIVTVVHRQITPFTRTVISMPFSKRLETSQRQAPDVYPPNSAVPLPLASSFMRPNHAQLKIVRLD
jgi:hypothetical protein